MRKIALCLRPETDFVRLSGNKSWRHQFTSCSVNERRRKDGAHVLCLHSLECNNSASAPTFRVHVIWPIEVSYIDEHTFFLFHLLLLFFLCHISAGSSTLYEIWHLVYWCYLDSLVFTRISSLALAVVQMVLAIRVRQWSVL